MAKKINNKDFIEEGFGKPLLDFFKMLDDQIELSKKNLKDFAKELKKEVGKNTLKSGADVKELDKQKEQTETIKRLFREQEQARKELAKIAEREAKREAQIEANRRKEIARTAEFEKRERIKLANELIRQRRKEEAANKRIAEREKRALEKKLLRQKQLIERNKTEAGSIAQLRQQLRLTTRAYDQLSAAERNNEQVGGTLLRTLRRQRDELFELERATGRSQRNVGNYAEAWQKSRLTISKGLGILGAVRALDAFGDLLIDGIQTIKEFDQQLAKVRAITGATESEFQALTKSARELGATTQFSAVEVAKLQEEFAKLGFSTTEILNASEATLRLAVATGSDLAQSATVAASTVRAFGKDASETQNVVDVMAKSFTSSALDLEKFQESIKLVAPIAKTTNTTLEESSAALSVLADRGISGSLAGTQLRKIMADLATKTGKSFQESLEISAKRLEAANTSAEKLAIAKELVGERAKGSLIALAENRQQLIKLTKAYNDAEGAAEAMANVVGDTLEGDVKRLSSAWDDLILNVGDRAKGAFRSVVQGATELVSTLSDLTRNIHAESDALEDQRIELNALVGQLTNANEGSEKRKDLINELNARYPKFLKNLDQEKLSNEVLTARLKEVNKQLLDQIKIKIEQEKLDERRREQAELEREAFDDQREAFRALEKINKNYNLQLDLTGKSLEERIKLTKEAIVADKDSEATGIERIAALATLTLLQDRYNDSQEEATEGAKDLAEAEKDSNEFLKAQGLELSSLEKDILGTADATKTATEATKEDNDANEKKLGLLQQIDEQTKKLREEQQASVSPERIKEIEKEIELLEKRKKALLGNTEAQDKLAKQTKKTKEQEIDEAMKASELAAEQLKKEVREREKAEKEKRKQIEKTQKESFEAGERFLNKQNELALKAADDRIQQSAQQVDRLTTLAASGNKEAARSLTAEAQNQRKLEAERERTIKRQVAQAAILAGLELTIAASRRGDSAPAQTAATQLNTISAAGTEFSNITNAVGFFTGTEKVSADLGEHKFYDGKDGYNINVHGTERILTGAQNAPLEGLSNEELSKAGVLYKKGAFDAHKYATDSLVVERKTASSNEELIKEVKELKKAYEKGNNKSEFKYDPIRKALRQDIKEKGKLTQRHYKKGRLL